MGSPSFYMSPLVPCRGCRVSVGGWGPVAVGFVTVSPELPRSNSGQADGGGSREVAPCRELGGVTASRAGHQGDLHPWDRGWGWGVAGPCNSLAVGALGARHRGHKGVAGDAQVP